MSFSAIAGTRFWWLFSFAVFQVDLKGAGPDVVTPPGRSPQELPGASHQQGESGVVDDLPHRGFEPGPFNLGSRLLLLGQRCGPLAGQCRQSQGSTWERQGEPHLVKRRCAANMPTQDGDFKPQRLGNPESHPTISGHATLIFHSDLSICRAAGVPGAAKGESGLETALCPALHAFLLSRGPVILPSALQRRRSKAAASRANDFGGAKCRPNRGEKLP